jgi:hypothetical protein
MYIKVTKNHRGCGNSVGMIMVQFEEFYFYVKDR